MLELDKVVKSTNLIHTNENQRKRKNTTNGSEPQKRRRTLPNLQNSNHTNKN